MADTEDIAYWLQGTQEDLSAELRRIGINSIDMLERKHLRALNHETAAVSGLRLAGYERPLPTGLRGDHVANHLCPSVVAQKPDGRLGI